MAWHVPDSKLRIGDDASGDHPWAAAVSPSLSTAGRFKDINEVADYWKTNYDAFQQKHRSLPTRSTKAPYPGSNGGRCRQSTILKSATVMRQLRDGRFRCWEGSGDNEAAAATVHCTHVWNYAQAVPHLFPALERSLRNTEFRESRMRTGTRVSAPICPYFLAGAQLPCGGRRAAGRYHESIPRLAHQRR